jgi:hypothetical protein
MSDHIKNIIDTLSLGVAVTAFLKILPALASILSIVWTGIRIMEWWKGRKNGNIRDD